MENLKTKEPISGEKRFILPQMEGVPAGIFEMGSEKGLPDERPVHSVWVNEFEIGIYPVTNQEYQLFLESTNFPQPSEWCNPLFNHPLQPVVSVTWEEVLAYCVWLSKISGQTYRLPTEAEREKACRGGLKSCEYPWGNVIPENRPVKNSWNRHPDLVGLYSPNGYGLFDMEGNIHEWCMDWYDPNYYARTSLENPQGPAGGERRVSRGGAWRHYINVSRCSARSSLIPAYRYNDYGFRLVHVNSSI